MMSNILDARYKYLVLTVIGDGEERENRTGTNTISVFAQSLLVPVSHAAFPILTTKKVLFDSVVRELLWFVSGCTDGKVLLEKGCRIWEANGKREFLDKRGLSHRREHDLGPVYGFQWRHFGAEYTNCEADYTGKGTDQLAEAIRLIREEPTSRRICVSAWNPAQEKQMALPPCHYFMQWNVSRCLCFLDLHVNMRSVDIGLGLPFNITSYALLLCMVARVTMKKPRNLTFSLGDTHVYVNHLDGLREQLERKPFPLPQLSINPDKEFASIDDFDFEDFRLENYEHGKFIKLPMAT